MIDFEAVTKEFHSLVVRRRELQTLLGSTFVGLGVFLQNALQGNLPPSLGTIASHPFAGYAVLLLVPCLLLSLRMARLHAGMVLNGVLYARLMQDQTFTRTGDPARAARLNLFGVSTAQCALATFLAAFATTVLVTALDQPPALGLAVGGLVAVLWVGLFVLFHHQAATFALRLAATEPRGPVTHEAWVAHIATSREEANLGLINDLTFAALMVFSGFEVLSGFGKVQTGPNVDLVSNVVKTLGPPAYALVMLVACASGMVSYLRVRLAIGVFSLQLDPNDRPFRPFRLTDSLLGYLLLVFLFVVSAHMVLATTLPEMDRTPRILLGLDLTLFALASLVEPFALYVLSQRAQRDRLG